MRRAIINGKYVQNPTPDQLSANTRFGDAANYHREADREEHYADLIQPYIGNKVNPQFVKMYPERARDQFTEQELKDY